MPFSGFGFVEAAKQSDFITGLPEKDDFAELRDRDGKLGFRAHLRRLLELGGKLEKEVHIHLDQMNDPREAGTETLIEGLRWVDMPAIPDRTSPTVWAVHMISPSGYPEARFQRLVEGLLEFNVGVIVCPTAAMSMRQLRPLKTHAHSSIARVLELCKRKVPVEIGTDNICDVFVPQSDGDMLNEIKFGGHAIRFAIPHVWAKLGAGRPLNAVDLAAIGRVLYEDLKAFLAIKPDWVPAAD